ncbi:MAG: family acetyltransferase [Segetibacter sp.]|nr:family acetyltransferase [Segetibacter sp.]
MEETIEIIPFTEEYAADFARLNIAWLEKYFEVEPIDRRIFSDPRTYILDNGGQIYIALYNNEIAGCFALMKSGNNEFELSKMAVDERFQGKQIGNKMLDYCLGAARQLGIAKLILYSNTRLKPAIHLYKKYGFVEVPLGDVEYKRADIKMEINLI